MKLLRAATIVTVLVVGLGLAQAAHADTMWTLAPGLTADAAFSASGGTWNLTMTFDNTLATTATVNQFTLALFQPSSLKSPYFTIVSDFAPGAGVVDSKGDNGSSTCSATGKNKGWLCVQFSPTAATLAANSTTSFSGSGGITPGVTTLDPSTLDLISNGTTNGTSKWAISAAGTGTSVPEPGTLALLGIGLFGLLCAGLIVERPRRRNTV